MTKFRLILFISTVIALLWIITSLFVNGILDDNSLISQSISLIIALLSFIIAYGSFLISIESKRPTISLSLNFNSRYNQVQLAIDNIGERGAKNIKITYSNNSIWHTGINKDLSSIAASISVLPSSSSIKKVLGSQQEIDIHSQTIATINYTDLSGIYKFTEKEIVNFNDYKDSLTYEEELTRTLYDLQQIPILLKAMNDTLSKLQ